MTINIIIILMINEWSGEFSSESEGGEELEFLGFHFHFYFYFYLPLVLVYNYNYNCCE